MERIGGLRPLVSQSLVLQWPFERKTGRVLDLCPLLDNTSDRQTEIPKATSVEMSVRPDKRGHLTNSPSLRFKTKSKNANVDLILRDKHNFYIKNIITALCFVE